jgi:hypothetical protein
LKIQFVHVATSNAEVAASATLSLVLASTPQQDSTCLVASDQQGGCTTVAWLAEQTGHAGETLVTWRGHARGFAAVLRTALAHGIDFGHYWQRQQHRRDHPHHLDLHRWLGQHLAQNLTLEQVYRLTGGTRPALTRLAVEQRLQRDCLTLALAWIKCSVVQGHLDVRSSVHVADVVAAAYRVLPDVTVRRGAAQQVKRFLKGSS